MKKPVPSDIRVHLYDGVSDNAVDTFHEAGITDVHQLSTPSSTDELIAQLQHPGGMLVGVRSATQIPAEVIRQSPHLLAVGRYGVGVDNIDRHAARAHGVAVFNGPEANTRSVAEHVILSIITLNRRLFDRALEMRDGRWNKVTQGSHEVSGKTLGLVGYGNVARKVSPIAEALGMHVQFSEVEDIEPIGNARRVSQDRLIETSDVISLHVPENPKTINMINEAALARMKRGAHIINTSRGRVIDIPALLAALNSGHVGGAAIDVFPDEPKSNGAFTSPLQDVPNVILTPHIGGATEEAQTKLGPEVSGKLVRYAVSGETKGALNLPHVPAFESAEKTLRLMVVHENRRGVAGVIGVAIGAYGFNISSDVLDTRDSETGVAIFDLEHGENGQTLDALKKLPDVRAVRIIA